MEDVQNAKDNYVKSAIREKKTKVTHKLCQQMHLSTHIFVFTGFNTISYAGLDLNRNYAHGACSEASHSDNFCIFDLFATQNPLELAPGRRLERYGCIWVHADA